MEAQQWRDRDLTHQRIGSGVEIWKTKTSGLAVGTSDARTQDQVSGVFAPESHILILLPLCSSLLL
ncbi:uncharacterized protein J3R85_014575 [Psidium guajava]|nr:uncharacterized protein J3R85_014575 [Psidium guajava]